MPNPNEQISSDNVMKEHIVQGRSSAPSSANPGRCKIISYALLAIPVVGIAAKGVALA